MGMLSRFYSDLESQDKKEIAAESFGTAPVYLQSWLRCLTDLRNRCAHYSRLYFWNFPAIPRIPKSVEYCGDNSLFSQMMMLKFLYPDKQAWNVVLIKIKVLIDEYIEDISLSHIGFPDNWDELLNN